MTYMKPEDVGETKEFNLTLVRHSQKVEYRTYCMKSEVSWSPSPCQGTVVLENCGSDWRYASGEAVSLEILGEKGWRLIHVLPSRDGYCVGIFERSNA